MKGFGTQNKSNNKSKRTQKIDNSKNEIINKAFQFHSEGNHKEAAKYYQYFINQGFKDHRVFSNYGVILKNFGKLKEAEFCLRKAIELKPNNAFSYSNLGTILKELGKLQQAELSLRKAIEFKPDYASAYSNLGIILKDLGKLKEAEFYLRTATEIDPNNSAAYYSLSLLNYSEENKTWHKKLFSSKLLNNKSKQEQIDIFFARANILHKEKEYTESAKYLKLANSIKSEFKRSNAQNLISLSKKLLNETNENLFQKKEDEDYPQCIFIVGMPRSGTTLLESILSKNSNVKDMGEVNILEETFLEWKKSNQKLNFAELYYGKINNIGDKLPINTNKYLYNYQYAGIICNLIPNAKIFHCFRNPLDNILSIFRANLADGNEYSASLIDCANVYLDQEKIISKYKSKFKSQIYEFNYDFLVNNPVKEIKSLISWLGWSWSDSYLTPHLSERAVFTASKVQVRSPINTKSINGWKNYEIMLKPAMQIITQNNKYKHLKY